MIGREIFVISDTHFGQAKAIEYFGRPFASREEMDETMIERWNAVVRPQDIVYHLGDVFFTGEGVRLCPG
jgi:calcineurin-like phosphoesterase family protein